MNLREAAQAAMKMIGDALGGKSRGIVEAGEWDGSAGQWEDAASYCADCLIDVNGEGAEKSKGLCLLPIRRPSDESDVYVKEAVHAAAGGHGISAVERPDGVSEEAWASAVKAAAGKLVSLYGEMDETPPESLSEAAGKETEEERAISISDIRDQLFAKLDEMGEYVYVHDLYLDGEDKFVVYSSGGHLFKMPLTVQGAEASFGAPEAVEVEFIPAGQRSFTIARQADGRLRWFAVACSAVLNRVGEIDSTALFDSFISHVAESGEYPELRLYHLPIRLGIADWVARDGWLLLSSGLLDEENPVARVFADAVENKRGTWGVSVGYQATSEPKRIDIGGGVTVPVFNTGILREESVLLEKDAAALLTSIQETEVYRMNKAAKDAILTMFGDGRKEEAEAFITEVDARNRSIEESGMIRREGTAEKPAEETSADPSQEQKPTEEVRTVVLDDQAVAAIAEQVRAAIPAAEPVDLSAIQSEIASLSKAVETLSGRLTGLEDGEEKRKREYLADLPARGEIRATYKPREEKAVKGASGAGATPTQEEINAKADAMLADLEKKKSRVAIAGGPTA